MRGIFLSHQLRALGARVFETHPGASLALSGLPLMTLVELKTDARAIETVVQHWQQQDIVFKQLPLTDHDVMSVQALLTAERFQQRLWYWRYDDWVV